MNATTPRNEMKTAFEQIKYDLKEQSDFGKVDIIDALAAIDAAYGCGIPAGYEKGIRDAAEICERKAEEFSPVGIARTALHEAKHEVLALLTKPKDKE